MGLEDRDWYREEPSKAWRKRWDASPGAARNDSTQTTRGPVRVYHAAWLAMLVSAALAVASWHWNAIPSIRLGSSPPTAPTGPRTAPAPRSPQSDKIVRLGSKPGFDVPATRVAQWWITDPRFGKVSVYVPVGQTPREALTVALAARGYQVIP